MEDEPLVRMVAADTLCDSGIMAWEASSAEEALTILGERENIGLVFTDVDLPGGRSGLELANQVSSERPEISLIITSGAVAIRDQDLPDNGEFLAKPYPPRDLVTLVSRKLDR